MTKKRSATKTDPELLRQLDAVAAGNNLVEAVCRLRPADPSQKAVSPEQAEELTRQVLQRVERLVGVSAKDVNVFRNLGSFVVSAEAPFLLELLKQPEIASAMANRQPEDA